MSGKLFIFFYYNLKFYLSISPLNVNGIGGIGGEWVGLACLVKVERIGTPAGMPYQQLAYDISSKCFDAAQFAQGIRDCWGIENRLHWDKDKYLDRKTFPVV